MSFHSALTLTAALICTAQAMPAAAQTLPEFVPGNFATAVANPYFPLEPGQSHTIAGTGVVEGETVTEHAVLTVLGAGPVIMGVMTVVMLDEAFENGVIVERTFDYYATDQDGNVWYMGEDVTNFRYDGAGGFTGTDTDSAWRAGVNGALPGIAMPAVPAVGVSLFQEHAPGEDAMDYAEILLLDAEVTGPAGRFVDVIKMFEGSTVDPEQREFKYWAAGYGMIRAEEALSDANDQPGLVVELQP